MNALPTSTRMLRAESSTPHQAAEKTGSNALQSLEETPLAGLDLDALICQALARCEMSHEQACLTMGVDQSLWTKQRKGDGHVSLQRLMKLPARFWLEFLSLLGPPLHVSMDSADIAELSLVRLIAMMQEAGTFALRLRGLRRVG